MTPKRLAELRELALKERREDITYIAEPCDAIVELCDAVEALQAELVEEREEHAVCDAEADLWFQRCKEDVEIANLAMSVGREMVAELEFYKRRAEKAERDLAESISVSLTNAQERDDANVALAKVERERDELAKQLGLYRPDEPCHCGSGCHPRHCKRHPWAYDLHVAQINHEQLREERDELEKERDEARAEVSREVERFHSAVMQNVGIGKDRDAAIKERDDLRAKLAACVAALERAQNECECPETSDCVNWQIRGAIAAAKGGG